MQLLHKLWKGSVLYHLDLPLDKSFIAGWLESLNFNFNHLTNNIDFLFKIIILLRVLGNQKMNDVMTKKSSPNIIDQ